MKCKFEIELLQTLNHMIEIIITLSLRGALQYHCRSKVSAKLGINT